MSALLRGPHHCAAVGNATAELIFRYLQSRCQAAGGSLTQADLEAVRSQFFQSLPNAFEFFEQSNQRCMAASASTAPAMFAREALLSTLLAACAQKAARTAFPMQITRFGSVWVGQFFNGLALFIRQHVCTDADERLRKIYAVEAVGKGVKVAVADLLQNDEVRRVLRECLAPLLGPGAVDKLAGPVSHAVSVAMAVERGIPKPDISKVTEQEMGSFLGWLPPQVNLALGT